MNRGEFIKSLIGFSSSIPFSNVLYSEVGEHINEEIKKVKQGVNGDMFGFYDKPIPNIKIGIIGIGNRGKTLLQMLPYMISRNLCEVTGICDVVESNTKWALDFLSKYQNNKPIAYNKDEFSWKKLIVEESPDLLLICTPWKWHTPMSLFGMENGCHVASEVPISYSIEDCWSLIETSERTRKHCIMLENCCYNEEELFILQLIENGVFGDITHTEGAYLHDLRAHLLSKDYYHKQWRLNHHKKRDGNFYTTHGLGPISFYMKIGRGDKFSHLVSMSSREKNLSDAAKREGYNNVEILCGDMNNTLIKTEKGKTILLQFDVHTGRPYSRINKVVGTKAIHDGYPSRLYIDEEKLTFGGHKWISKEKYKIYKKEHKHPIVKKLSKISKSFKQGHGGMDFVMMYRLINALNVGKPLDINLYDGVMWSAITPLSELSVLSESSCIYIPDFTNGNWQKDNDLHINAVY